MDGPREIHGELHGLDSRQEYLDAVIQLLSHLIPGDGLAWNSVDVRDGTAEVVGYPRPDYAPETADQLIDLADDHPMMVSYLTGPPHPLPAPRRLSDVVSQRDFRRTRTYAELFKPRAIEHQLTIMTTASTPTGARCWAVVRSGKDFTDADLDLAERLQPVLALLDRAYPADGPTSVGGAVATPPSSAAARPDAVVGPSSLPLTRREHEVLSLIATGLSARLVGRRLGVSERTIEKHLENTYVKLGCHDRVSAIALLHELDPGWPSAR